MTQFAARSWRRTTWAVVLAALLAEAAVLVASCLPRDGLVPDGAGPPGEAGAGGEPCLNCTTTSSTGSQGGGGATACALSDVTKPSDCPSACESVYACGLLACGSGPLCPGFGEAAGQLGEESFAADCIRQCESLSALVQLVDPSACDATVAQLEGASPDFAYACEHGAAAGGSGGAPCVSCAEALGDANATRCAGADQDAYDALALCACDTGGACTALCGMGASDCMLQVTSCQDCVQDPSHCLDEWNTCSAF